MNAFNNDIVLELKEWSIQYKEKSLILPWSFNGLNSADFESVFIVIDT